MEASHAQENNLSIHRWNGIHALALALAGFALAFALALALALPVALTLALASHWGPKSVSMFNVDTLLEPKRCIHDYVACFVCQTFNLSLIHI